MERDDQRDAQALHVPEQLEAGGTEYADLERTGPDSPDPVQADPEEIGAQELNELIERLCDSKAEEFRMLGYEQVTGVDIWNCVNEKYKKEMPALHQVVNDILSLKVTRLMNWMTMNAFRGL